MRRIVNQMQLRPLPLEIGRLRGILFFNQKNELVGWRNVKTEEVKWSKKTPETSIQNLAFSGIHVISPAFFDYFPKQKKAFSIIPIYLKAAKKSTILAYSHDETIWLDVGKLPALKEAETIVPKLRLD